jgi:uncharacterized protein YjiS (DUF1127 family)
MFNLVSLKQAKQRKNKDSEPEMELMKTIREWRRFRATRDALVRLSDRELNDLGIGRGDIDYVARKAMN